MARLLARVSANMLLTKEQHTALVNNFTEHFDEDSTAFRPEQFREEIQLQGFMLYHGYREEERQKARKAFAKLEIEA